MFSLKLGLELFVQQLHITLWLCDCWPICLFVCLMVSDPYRQAAFLWLCLHACHLLSVRNRLIAVMQLMPGTTVDRADQRSAVALHCRLQAGWLLACLSECCPNYLIYNLWSDLNKIFWRGLRYPVIKEVISFFDDSPVFCVYFGSQSLA